VIIQVLANLCDEGYLEKEENSLVSLFFSGSNVAFRREVFQQIGFYDTNCATGEDQDISIRINNTEWELYFQPRAIVGHKCRKSAKAFIKQWYRYGLHHPYIFKKFNPKSLAVYRRKRGIKEGVLYRRVLYAKRFPLHALIFISPFLIMNLFLLLTILTLSLGLFTPSIILGSITFVLGIYYFMPDIEIKHLFRTIRFILLRYMANLALLIGGLLGGAKLKMIYISGTLDYKG
jgi:cellulose synthase/poly-beta-1,6-N-acetylglucosamine synthase-like glycosyltransferase